MAQKNGDELVEQGVRHGIRHISIVPRSHRVARSGVVRHLPKDNVGDTAGYAGVLVHRWPNGSNPFWNQGQKTDGIDLEYRKRVCLAA